jgi:hypothetical protein
VRQRDAVGAHREDFLDAHERLGRPARRATDADEQHLRPGVPFLPRPSLIAMTALRS